MKTTRKAATILFWSASVLVLFAFVFCTAGALMESTRWAIDINGNLALGFMLAGVVGVAGLVVGGISYLACDYMERR
jgi:uncharacterized membrane protein YjfL (UPF0719 family)